MFVYTKEDIVLNLKLVEKIYVCIPTESRKVCIVAKTTDNHPHVLRYFETEKEALTYLDRIYRWL